MELFRKVLFSVSVSIFGLTANAQTFQRTYGNTGLETGTCIQNTLDSNYIISGTTSSFSNGYDDMYLLKIDPGGNILWSKAYGGTYKDRAYYVNICSDGGYILTGTTTIFSTGNYTDLYMVRTDSQGGLLWSTTVGGTNDDNGWYVTEANDGGFLCVGSSKSFTGGSYDGFVVKTDAAGAVQWKKVYGGSNTDNFYGMSTTSDGGYIITGIISTNSFGSSDMWLVKLDSGGDTLWTRQYGKITEDAGNAVIQTSDGGYLVAGDIHIQPAAGNHNSCLLKTDATGAMQWVKTYGSSPGSEIAWDLRQTTDGGYLVLGSSGTFGNGGGGDMLVIQTDNSGNMQWAKAYGSTAFDDFWYSETTTDGGTIMVGSTSTGGKKVHVLRLDGDGNNSCNTTTVTPLVNTPVMQTRSGGISITSAGSVITVNTIETTATTVRNDPCSTVSTNEPDSDPGGIKLFPNPSSGQFNVSIPDHRVSETELKILDPIGNYVLCKQLQTGETAVNLKSPPGLYFYQIFFSGNLSLSGKIIIID